MSFLRSKVRTFVYKRMTSFFLSRNIRIHHFVDHLWGHSFDDLSAPPRSPRQFVTTSSKLKAGDDLHPMSWLFNSSWLVVMTSFCWRIPTSVRLFQVSLGRIGWEHLPTSHISVRLNDQKGVFRVDFPMEFPAPIRGWPNPQCPSDLWPGLSR